MTPVVIYKNASLLKHKLAKLEPRDKRHASHARLAFAIDRLDFNRDIPILREKHLRRYEKIAYDSDSDETSDESEDELAKESSDSEQEKAIEEQDDNNKSRISEDSDDDQTTATAKIAHLKDKSREQDDTSDKLNGDNSEPKKGNPVLDKSDGPVLSEESSAEDPADDDEVLDEQSVCESQIDKLVLQGPIDDEFRQYDNDENDEAESSISRNLKKIRTEPVKPPAPSSAPASTPAPAAARPALVQKPPFVSANPLTRTTPSSASVPTPVKHFKASPREEPPKISKPEDLEKPIGEKNWRIVYTELDRNKTTYKTNESARAILKKAVFACLDLDETYELINFIKLVFEFEYPGDTNFWEMLIGKLKRKVSPHILDHRFKCETDPKFVINNYNLVILDILKHFNSSSKMSNVRISFHLASYLALCGREKELTPTRTLNMPTTALIQPMPPAVEDQKGPVQVNQDPTSSFNVSLVKTANGNMHFKIKTSRRENNFSPMFL